MLKTNAVRLLDQANISYRMLHYTYEVGQLDVGKIARDNDLTLAQIFKTLVCQGDKRGVAIALVPGDSQLDLKRIAKLSGYKKMTLLPHSELPTVTGYIRGGCSPLGMKKNYPVFMDESAHLWDEIFINAGARGLLFACSPNDIAHAFGFHRAKIVCA